MTTEIGDMKTEMTTESEQSIKMQIIPYFRVNSTSIILEIYPIGVGKCITWDNDIAYNERGDRLKSLPCGIWRNGRIPSLQAVWECLKGTICNYNEKCKIDGNKQITFYNEAGVKIDLNEGLVNAMTEFDSIKRSVHKKDESEAEPEVVDTIDRINSFVPYSITKKNKDGEIVDQPIISNFNIIFNNILQIDDVLRVSCSFNYIETKTNKQQIIPNIETDKLTFHNQIEFVKFFACFSNKLWYDKTHTGDLLTQINIDETTQNPEIVQKTQNFGWNNDFTAYLTPEWDFELKMQDGIPERDHLHQFELVNQIKKYCDGHGLDYDNLPESGCPKNLGSVRILNDKIASSIKLGFRSDSNVKDTLLHIKNTLFKLSPVVDRTIPIVFLAPLTSILNKLDMSYQIYLQGKSGYGKSQLSILFMNFFANVDSDEQLVNILRDKPNAIEEIGYYHRDCLFVIDNFKESAIDKKEYPKMTALLQSIADRQGSKRMSKSDFGSFRVRGSTLVTGEEILQDASTIRKYDVVQIVEDKKIDLNILKECHNWKSKYSNVTADYIKWLMQKYGNEIKDEVEKRKNKQQLNFTNPLFVLNMVGYEFFIEYLYDNKIIDDDEYTKMYQGHMQVLKDEEHKKEDAVEEKMTAQKMIHAIRSGLSSRKFRIINDPEYDDNKHVPPIGQTNRECTEIVYYTDTYFLLKGVDSSLPDDIDSVWEQIKDDEHIEKRTAHRCDNKKKERLIHFKREYIVPRTDIDEKAKWTDIASMIPDIISAHFNIVEKPSAKQYNEIINYLMQLYLTVEKKDEKKRFIEDVEPLLKLAFRMKFGNDWSVPVQ